MRVLRANRKWFLLFAALLITASVISVGVFSAKQERQTLRRRGWLTSIPRQISKVKDLEIINARIVRLGSEAPGIAFEIKNHSPRAVVAVDIMCGDAGMSKDGLWDEQNPEVVIEPYGTLAVEINDELSPGLPIVLGGAIFEDGLEEGTDTSLKAIHRGRMHERARLKIEREGKQEGQAK